MREERQGRRRERWLDECVEVVISPECLHHQLLLRVCMTWHPLSVCMWWYHRAAHTRAASPERVRSLVCIAPYREVLCIAPYRILAFLMVGYVMA